MLYGSCFVRLWCILCFFVLLWYGNRDISVEAFQSPSSLNSNNNNNNRYSGGELLHRRHNNLLLLLFKHEENVILDKSRRGATLNIVTGLVTVVSALSTIGVNPDSAVAIDNTERVATKQDKVGARWVPLKDQDVTTTGVGNDDGGSSLETPTPFIAYAARILLNYDTVLNTWWMEQVNKYSLLPDDEAKTKLNKVFASFVSSVQSGIDDFVIDASGSDRNYVVGFEALAQVFVSNYASSNSSKDDDSRRYNNEVSRHLGILFSLLPAKLQPRKVLDKLSSTVVTQQRTIRDTRNAVIHLPQSFIDDNTLLLSSEFGFAKFKNSYSIVPTVEEWEYHTGTAFDKIFGDPAISPVTRPRPNVGADVYTLFGLSGALGCSLTHTVVVPLDVVKTRLQTNPQSYSGLADTGLKIVQEEGFQALLLGMQATILGYMWYGLSVYPSYDFVKRFIALNMDPSFATVNAIGISLAAGASSAVLASIGLTPLEACRIRAVADPDRYREKGVIGTAKVIASESSSGWQNLYAGFPPLVTRQVIFGSVKFLAFERTCEAVYSAFPELQSSPSTALCVSLFGGFAAGALASVISQPADSVLTYVAKKSGDLNVVNGAIQMVQEEGITSLFSGLVSRCVWAGCIIGGQFLLYDVFRNSFGVSPDDLLQRFEIVIR